ncbi:M23 family metallopeptidase [Agromyces aerolatus]|uniref:M23 family metallopeptidase n=1 Tax=Agromyces sp. LY-1074 TaxID=3074080 RepID=UPI002864C9AB|nr:MULTISPECIES: M23 family metallopeptidase [unclassified Agromyces]MDR5698642.1 M23 family metallopeptidase [Agromyces sp. LY-1074]MDR5704936.1 M23 family metallopeptidase [Agromyces sp. LY-1358]
MHRTPRRANPVRRPWTVLSAGCAAIVLAFGAAAPAQAAEVPPTTPPAVTAEPTPEPAAEPSTEPTPDPTTTPEPTDPPPSEPPPTEPPPSEPPPTTPPPTEPPPTTPPPTEPPPTTPPPTTPPPTTPPPTTPPTTTPAPTPTTPGTAPAAPARAPVMVGSGPVLRIVSSPDPGLAGLLTARTALDRATLELRGAESELAAAKADRTVARQIATQLDESAAEAREQADEAGRAYLTANRSGDAANASMAAAYGAGQDLLAGLGGMARLSALDGEADELLDLAERLDTRAEAAEERAESAWAEADDVPVEDRQQRVRAAEASVTQARAELSGLQTRVAASSVALIDSLPADSGQLSEQGWSLPVAGRTSDEFGPRPEKPLPGVNEFHRGTDVAASCGAPVFAATGGIVVEARANGSYGNWILIDHGAGVSTGYAHLQDGGVLVSPGQSVGAGQLIATVGSTGASTGCHLHFEVRLGGVAVDAKPFLAARGIALG